MVHRRFFLNGRFLLLIILLALMALPHYSQVRRLGPEVKSFLSFLKQEEDELKFQIEHDEISREEYTLSLEKISILREIVLEFTRKTGEDRVPEYHVITEPEAEQLIPGGTEALLKTNPGELIAEKWRFIRSVTRHDKFFIIERTDQKH